MWGWRLEAADFVLMRNNFEDVITAVDLSWETFAQIKWIYVLAMGYNVLGFPIVVGVLYRVFF